MPSKELYSGLLSKIDQYIRKFYLNQMLKGLIYTGTLLLIAFLLVVILEYMNNFGSLTRTILFYAFSSYLIVTVSYFIVVPFLHYNRLGKRISEEEAARTIGKHFPEVKDKLLNLLQLKKNGIGSLELLEASIEQKATELSPFKFSNAINLRENKQYLKYLLIPLLGTILLLIFYPDVVNNSTKRLVRYDQHFEKPSPFNFIILNEQMEMFQFEDFHLEVKVEGNILPANMFVLVDGNKYRLKKKDKSHFYFTFKNLAEDLTFMVGTEDFYSKPHHIKVLAKPTLKNFYTDLHYPSYIGKENERFNNIGDLTVPEGTEINWNFKTINTDRLILNINDSMLLADKVNGFQFASSYTFVSNSHYDILQFNDHVEELAAIKYFIKVIKDQFPQISVTNYEDSIGYEHLFFTGDIMDDYGFSRLVFSYKKKNENRFSTESIPFTKGISKGQFFHTFRVADLELNPGESLEYYFQIWDNDAFNHFKSTRTNITTFRLPSIDEMKTATDRQSEHIKDQLKKNMQQAKQNKLEIAELKKRVLQKKNISWEDNQQLKELMAEQNKLQQSLKELSEENKLLNKQHKNYAEDNEEIRKKQEKIEEMFDALLTDEVKKLLEDIEDLFEKMNKNDAMENFDDAEMSNEEMNNELDKMLELFKELEFEQKYGEMLTDLKKVTEKQKEALKSEGSNESLEKEQQEIEKEFESIKKELNQLEELNEALDNKKELDVQKPAQEAISNQMEQAQDALQKGNKKQGKQKQQEAAEAMEQMAQEMQEQMDKLQADQAMEDYEAIRQILDNLITLSFDQEGLILRSKQVHKKSDDYVLLVQEQYKLKDDCAIIKDSLVALSKRVFELESFITKELFALESNIDKSIDYLEQRKINNSYTKQQYAMTSLNNLALMLNESMEQMQQQMSMKMKGSQNCQNPGSKPGSKPGDMEGMRSLQQKLGKQLEEMKKGNKGGKGRNGMSKGFAQMAQQQAKIRQMMQALNKELGKDGSDSFSEIEKLIQEMEQNEKDLVNKKLDSELINRQQEITTRMLEAEKAIKERELSDEREAEKANEYELLLPKSFEKYKKMKEKQLELYRTVPPSLKPFYKDLVEEYFNKLTL